MSESECGRLCAELRELGVKIDNLTELFNRAAYGDGFTRCAAQASRLAHVEEGVALCHTRIGGVKKWLVAGLVSLVSVLANFLWNVVRGSLQQ